jgi:peptidyl-dipeptidase Dcp
MSSFSEAITTTNPLLLPFTKNHGIPPFADINPMHYKEAFLSAFSEHITELKEIANNKDEPSFENTILAFDVSGALLSKVGKVYYNLCSSLCPPELQTVQSEMAVPLSAHRLEQ